MTGRSFGPKAPAEYGHAEIRRPGNIKRLAADVQHVTKLIVFCGDKAKIASLELSENQLLLKRPKFAFLGHLGILGLNKIVIDVDGKTIVNSTDQKKSVRCESLHQIKSENTRRRLDVVAASLVASID
jgi:hypothetical protein